MLQSKYMVGLQSTIVHCICRLKAPGLNYTSTIMIIHTILYTRMNTEYYSVYA